MLHGLEESCFFSLNFYCTFTTCSWLIVGELWVHLQMVYPSFRQNHGDVHIFNHFHTFSRFASAIVISCAPRRGAQNRGPQQGGRVLARVRHLSGALRRVTEVSRLARSGGQRAQAEFATCAVRHSGCFVCVKCLSKSNPI